MDFMDFGVTDATVNDWQSDIPASGVNDVLEFLNANVIRRETC